MGARPVLKFKRLRATAVIPQYMTAGAAGLDLTSAEETAIPLAPGARGGVPTGLAMAIPVGFEGQVRPRSGLASRHGVTVVNAPGTIDSDYRGEIVVWLVNMGTAPFVVEPGARIAQLVIAPVVQVQLEELTELSETTRGTGGFGSTGS